MDYHKVDLARLEGEMLATYQRELAREISDPERVRAVYGSEFMDASRQGQYEAVCAAAAQLLEADRASIVMIVENEAIVVASTRAGGGVVTNAAQQSYCQNIVATREPLSIVESSEHALVCYTEASRIGGVRSYLGVPLIRHGFVIGALCVWTYKRRDWTASEVSVLTSFASALMNVVD